MLSSTNHPFLIWCIHTFYLLGPIQVFCFSAHFAILGCSPQFFLQFFLETMRKRPHGPAIPLDLGRTSHDLISEITLRPIVAETLAVLGDEGEEEVFRLVVVVDIDVIVVFVLICPVSIMNFPVLSFSMALIIVFCSRSARARGVTLGSMVSVHAHVRMVIEEG